MNVNPMWCAKCCALIPRVQVFHNPNMDIFIFNYVCHGQQGRMSLPRVELENYVNITLIDFVEFHRV